MTSKRDVSAVAVLASPFIDTPGNSPATPLLLRSGFMMECENTIELKDEDRVVYQYRHVAMMRKLQDTVPHEPRYVKSPHQSIEIAPPQLFRASSQIRGEGLVLFY